MTFDPRNHKRCEQDEIACLFETRAFWSDTEFAMARENIAYPFSANFFVGIVFKESDWRVQNPKACFRVNYSNSVIRNTFNSY